MLGVKFVLTIFTPTYNRGHLIKRVYDSLRKQTDKSFEWIIIDDGGIDNTEQIINKLILDNKMFPMSYKKINHGGKHRAINQAINMSQSDYFMIVDDDDYLMPKAVEIIKKWIETISGDKKLAGVSGLKGFSERECVGQRGHKNCKGYIDGNVFQLKEMGFTGDMAEVYRTEILKRFPFPEYEGETYISENYLWYQVALAGYNVRWFQEIIYICEYLPSGLTCNRIRNLVCNPMGWFTCALLKTKYEKVRVSDSFIEWYILACNDVILKKIKEKFGNDICTAIVNRYNDIISKTIKYIKEDNKNIAVYGTGMYGEMFYEISKRIDVEILFAIDKAPRDFYGKKVYKPDDDYPIVDIVFVTIKDYDADIFTSLNGRIKNVIWWNDLWNE